MHLAAIVKGAAIAMHGKSIVAMFVQHLRQSIEMLPSQDVIAEPEPAGKQGRLGQELGIGRPSHSGLMVEIPEPKAFIHQPVEVGGNGLAIDTAPNDETL